jgi:hypothetical protein
MARVMHEPQICEGIRAPTLLWNYYGEYGVPRQCRDAGDRLDTLPVVAGLRSVFPSTAVRQPSSQGLRRCFRVPEETAANVNQAHGIESPLRIARPSESSALASIGQVPTKASVDEAL